MASTYRAAALTLVTALVQTGSGRAFADSAAADQCARQLSPQAVAIYRATAPDIHAETVIADALKKHVRPMVMNGQMDRVTAMTAARAAGACLKLLRQ